MPLRLYNLFEWLISQANNLHEYNKWISGSRERPEIYISYKDTFLRQKPINLDVRQYPFF